MLLDLLAKTDFIHYWFSGSLSPGEGRHSGARERGGVGRLSKSGDEIAHTSMEQVMRLNSREFRLYTFLKFRSLNTKINLVITLLLILLGAVIGTKLV